MAQIDAFLKLDKINGESTDSKHKDEIEILSWNWGSSNSGTMHRGTGGGTGKVQVQDMHFVKHVDKATPLLNGACTQGTHIAKGLLTVRKAGGTQLEYFKVELGDILVSSVQTGGSDGSPTLTEQFSLNFATFKVIYTPQDAKGSAAPAVQFGYDIAKSKTI